MEKSLTDMLADIAGYYSAKLAEHGETPAGVDWNGEDSQELRFRQLTRIIQSEKKFSINDLGCGYGALYEYLKSHYADFRYYGYDISDDMIAAAGEKYSNNADAAFFTSASLTMDADYGIASGIFNVKLQHSDQDWMHYLETTLDMLDSSSRLGFSFNCLTSYSDSGKMQQYLYYADPGKIFDLCKRRYSRNIALLHDYGLYEFTILVRKQL